jgi:hypothetical protein
MYDTIDFLVIHWDGDFSISSATSSSVNSTVLDSDISSDDNLVLLDDNSTDTIGMMIELIANEEDSYSEVPTNHIIMLLSRMN